MPCTSVSRTMYVRLNGGGLRFWSETMIFFFHHYRCSLTINTWTTGTTRTVVPNMLGSEVTLLTPTAAPSASMRCRKLQRQPFSSICITFGYEVCEVTNAYTTHKQACTSRRTRVSNYHTKLAQNSFLGENFDLTTASFFFCFFSNIAKCYILVEKDEILATSYHT